MHRAPRIRPQCALLLSLLALAACDGGENRALARADQLDLQIIRGKGMHLPVRDPATPEDDPGRAPQPVIARVSVALDAEEQQELGATGPSLRVPGVEIRWHVLEPFCSAELAATPVEGDSAVNYFLRPTRVGVCHLVAEGVVDGRVFASDTAVASFDPGPVASFRPLALVPLAVNGRQSVPALVNRPVDAYGNPIVLPPAYTAVLTSGQPAITLVDTMLHGWSEGVGNLRMTVGATTGNIPVWSIRAITTHYWSLSWACYDVALPGGRHADSAHFWMDSAQGSYGSVSARGIDVGLRGGLHSRTWVRGEPVREALRGTTLFLSQRPGSITWHNGQVSTTREAFALRYDGGNLCEPPPEGGAWARFAPLQAIRGDSIIFEFP